MLSIATRRSRRDIARIVAYLVALAVVIFLLMLSIDYLQHAEATGYGSIPEVGPAVDVVTAPAEPSGPAEMGIDQTFTAAGAPEPETEPAVESVPAAVAAEPAVPELGEGGHIYIPAVGVDYPLNLMTSTTDQPPLDRGPSWLSQTGKPGQPGNCCIAGHRSTYTQPFHDLGELVAGDIVVITDAGGSSHVYQVDRIYAVDPSQVEVMSATPDATFTLITCHPIGSSRQRLIVQGHML